MCENYRMKIGYARVSEDEQNLDLQLDALRAEGCEEIFEDIKSGADSRRKGFAAALARCGAGDVLVGWKLDRVARSLYDLVVLAKDLKERGAGLKILTGEGAAVDVTHAQGRMVFGILAVIAEFEWELIRERTAAGMKAAKRRGVHVGRPRKLGAAQLDMAAQLMAADRSQKEVARALGVAVSTLRENMKERAA